MKKAFTMLELVFVIVIMGIAASIGAEIIAKLYENYIQTRSINKLQFQTDLVLNQIAKRLTYRIKDSVIGESNTTAPYIVALPYANSSYPILAWIGKSYESSLGNTTTTGWSGFVDLKSSDTNKTQIKTNGSHLGYARDIIYALSYGDIDINTSTFASPSHAVLIFKGKDDYNVSKYGWNKSGNHDYVYYIKVDNKDTLKIIDDKNITTAYEQYDLVWTAYALVPEINGAVVTDPNASDFNLTLKYNFQPWDGEKYDDNTTINPDIKSSVLMEHVSSFKFMQYGETIRLKLCIRDDTTNDDYGFCKEKVVF